jgi:hypothetical protein
VRLGSLDLVRTILAYLSASVSPVVSSGAWSSVVAWTRTAVRWLAAHTGVPALVVGALLLCVGYRVLKRTARFVVEVAAVTLALALASELGWIRW